MQITKITEFDTTIDETNALLKDIEVEFEWEGQRNYSYRALRAVLHTLRDRLTVEEDAAFAASLPILVRGLFYSEWRPMLTPKKMDRIDFLEDIADKMGVIPAGDEIDVADIVRGVLVALRKYISSGEMRDVMAIMPKDIKPLLREVM